MMSAIHTIQWVARHVIDEDSTYGISAIESGRHFQSEKPLSCIPSISIFSCGDVACHDLQKGTRETWTDTRRPMLECDGAGRELSLRTGLEFLQSSVLPIFIICELNELSESCLL